MKRPDGFDTRRRIPDAAPEPSSKARVARLLRLRPELRAAALSAPSTSGANSALNGDTQVEGSPVRPESSTRSSSSTSPVSDDRAAQRQVRRAARARRRFEQREVRRFTRRSRRRRLVWLAVAIIAGLFSALVAIAVFSPLLALKQIRVDGASRLDAAEIIDAVDGQLDTPLALIDFDRMTTELGEFPLIRSFVTETIPPDTLVIHIVEREPVGLVAAGAGFSLVDPAGVVIETSTARVEGIPLIDTAGAPIDSAAFDAAVEVLIALPESVASRLDTISAASRDNVTLTLVGDGAKIIWGSAEDSEYKARVLAPILALNLPNVSEYNVSAPGQVTYR